MYIEKIDIDSFGMLSGYTAELGEGINVIEGKNESGKSTLAAFIGFIFYGLDKKSTGDNLSERQRYVNWKNGTAEGSMTVSDNGKRYKIKRSVVLQSRSESGKENWKEAVSVTECETGLHVFEGEVPGEVFFGVPKEIFDSTAYIRQLGNPGVAGAFEGEAIDNIMFSASEKTNAQKAITKIDEQRRVLLHKNEHGGEIYELTVMRAAVESELAEAKNDNTQIIAKEGELAYKEKTLEDIKAAQKKLSKKKDAYNTRELLKKIEALNELKSKIAEKKTELAAFVEAKSVNGFFPTKEYARELFELEKKLVKNKAELSEREVEYSKLKYENAGDIRLGQISEEIRKTGGEETVKGEYGVKKQSAHNMGLFGAIFVIFGLLFFLAGVYLTVFVSVLKTVGIALLALGILFVSIAIGFFASKGGKKKALREFEKKFGLEAGETLDGIIEKCAENDAEIEKYKDVLEKIDTDKAALQKETEKTESEIREKAALWGKEYNGSASEIAGEAESIAEKAEEIERELEKLTVPKESAEKELAGYDEKALREHYLSLGEYNADELDISSIEREFNYNETRLTALSDSKIELEKQLIGLSSTAKDPIKLSAKLDDTDKRLEELKKRHAAYILAEEAIETARNNMRKSITPRIFGEAQELMSEITDGKYKDGGISTSSGKTEIVFESEGEVRGLDYFSTGTKDAAYTALRLSLMSVLYRKSTPPIVLDESLAFLDETRMKKLLGMLAKDGKKQVIIFSCRDNEKNMLDKMTKYNYIKL